jgi:hypothetical protein
MTAPQTRERSYLDAALEGIVANVRAAVEGVRDETINREAFAAGTLIPAGLDRQRAYDALVEAAISTGYPQKDARYKITRALDQGEQQPRTIPERNGNGVAHVSPPRKDYLQQRGLVDRELLSSSGVTLHSDHVAITQDAYTQRRYFDGREPRYDNDPGEKPLFHFGDTQSADVVGVAEGVFTALAAAQAGLPTLCTLGSFTDKAGAFLQTKKRVLLIKDADKGGASFESKARSLLDADVETVSMPQGYSDLAEVAERASDPIAAVRRVLETSGDPDVSLVKVSDVEREPVEWLWRPFLPKGKSVLIFGDPNVGKTTAALDITARVTKGDAFPDGSSSGEPRDVIWLTAEDSIADTLRPRLEAAGADIERVHVFQSVGTDAEERLPSFPADLPKLRRLIEKTRAALVVWDPLEAYLSQETNTWKSSDVRRALHPFKPLAEETGATFLYVAHLTKGGGGNPLYRALGSIAFMAAVRAALLVTSDPTDDSRRVLSVAKTNLGPVPPSLLFRIEEDPEYMVARISWEGTTDLNAHDLLDTHDDSGTVQGDAKERLRELLSDGESHSADSIERTIMEELGCSQKTIQRARRKLGVRATPVHRDGRIVQWRWELPDKKAKATEPSAQESEEPTDPTPTEHEPPVSEPEQPPLAAETGEPRFGPKATCARCSNRSTFTYFTGEPICSGCIATEGGKA